ncbi:MAG: NAD-dependent epimerase/dehydratase family protein [Opitutales bacterium]
MRNLALVTGGYGFIGKAIVRSLLARGFGVRVLDDGLAPPDFPGGCDVIAASVTDPLAVARACEGVRWVFHTAGTAHFWASEPDIFENVNLGGTQIVLQEAWRQQVERIVHTSSETILPELDGKLQSDAELPPLDSMPGPYTSAKWRADAFAREMSAQGAPIVITYPTAPLGTGDFNGTPPTQMVQMFLDDPPPALLDCALNFVSVDDVGEGSVRAAQRGNRGERFILGAHNLSLSDFAQRLHALGGPEPATRRIPYPVARAFASVSEQWAKLLGKTPSVTVEGVALTRKPLWCDTETLEHRLGLVPRDLDSVLRETMDWLRERNRDDGRRDLAA